MPDVKCPNGHKLNVPDAYLGQEVRCSVCNVTFVTPTSGEPEAAAPSPAPASAAPETPAVETSPATPAIAAAEGSVAERHRSRSGRGFNPFGLFDSERIGKPALFIGLVLVIFSRGCDGLGSRWANRLQAKAQSVPRKFSQKTTRLLRDQEGADAAKIREERNEKRDKLQDSWSDLNDTASNARTNHVMWAFFYHCLFVIGSMALTVGLLIVGFNGSGSERTICLIMIAIITFSIYIVGAPWLEGAFAALRQP